jgi:hypothetical protein
VDNNRSCPSYFYISFSLLKKKVILLTAKLFMKKCLCVCVLSLYMHRWRKFAFRIAASIKRVGNV